eukprot:2318765-Rhodomonas_salina.3
MIGRQSVGSYAEATRPVIGPWATGQTSSTLPEATGQSRVARYGAPPPRSPAPTPPPLPPHWHVSRAAGFQVEG